MPPVRRQLVPRRRLAPLLEEGVHRKLTVILAPAGFGKSTLLVSWLRESAHRTAWLSLDDADNDPVRFLRYLMASLQTINDELGTATEPMLFSPQQASPRAVLTVLINDLAAVETDITLVMDDYHVITTP